MPTTVIKTTSRQAKAAFKKSGPRIPEQQLKEYTRREELEQRAEEIKEREKKRKQLKRKREEKEQRERDAKRRTGMGLATQLAGYSHTQKRMKIGMEAFLGKGKETRDSKGCHVINDISLGLVAVGDGTNEQMQKAESWQGDARFLDDEAILENLSATQKSGTTTTHCFWDQTSRERKKRKISDTPLCESECTSKDDSRNIANRDRNFDLLAKERRRPPIQPQIQLATSPTGLWAEFLVSNSQITRELSQSTPTKQIPNTAASNIFSTQDLGMSSNELSGSEKSPKTNNPGMDAGEGVVTRDFAFFKQTPAGEVILGTPIHKSLSHGSSKAFRSQGLRAVLEKSPKMIASGFKPPPAERSFSSKFDDFGLSTQMLQEAVADTDSDTEEEDFSPAIPAAPSSAEFDRMLMPPPPARTSPKVFKPPSSARKELGGDRNFQAFGLSTQIMQDALCDEDLSDTDTASSSFGAGDIDDDFWDNAVLGKNPEVTA